MTEDDAWNAILGGDSDAGGAKKKKGKAKAKEADGTRKRLISDDESGPEGDPAGPSRGKRKSPGKKVSCPVRSMLSRAFRSLEADLERELCLSPGASGVC